MIEFKRTGNNILGIDEYYYEGVRFLYKKGKSSKICCFFPSFVQVGKSQRYHYLREFSNIEETTLWFLDTEKGRGSYALDDNFKFLNKIKFIIEKIKKMNSKIFLLGSSKGATIALFIYSLFTSNKDIYLCVHAPQFYLVDFLNTTKSNDIKNNIESIFQGDYDQIFHTLYKDKKFKACSRIYISCGVDDGYHLRKALPYLFDLLVKKKLSPIFIPVSGSHNDTSIQEYIKIVHSLLNGTLEYDIYKFTIEQLINLILKFEDHILFENTIFNKSHAESILKNHFKNNTKIISIKSKNYIIETPYFADVLYTIYYRDNEGTKKNYDYTKKRIYYIKVEGNLREIAFFLKLNSKVLTVKLDSFDIEQIILNTSSDAIYYA